MNILIVDDRPPNLRLQRFILESEGHTVQEAADGIEALEILNRDKVDVIISDILMPRMDGYRLCQEVRKSERLREIPFIFYTATYTSPGDEKLCMELGGDKYMQKPATAEMLLAAVQEVTKNGEKRSRRATRPMDEHEVMKEYSVRLVFKLEEKIAELLIQSAAMETAANAIVITDANGVILKVNPAFRTLSGFTAEEAIGQTPRILKSGRHDQAFYHDLWQTILDGKTWRGEFVNRRKDGSLYQGEQTITPVRAQGSKITHFIGIMNDVTESRRIKEALGAAKETLQTIFDSAPVAIAGLDLQGRITKWNAGAARMFGWTEEEMIGRICLTIPEDGMDDYLAMIQNVSEHGPQTGMTRWRKKGDGELIHVSISAAPLRDTAGKVTGVMVIVEDITERVRTSELLSAVAEGIPDAVFVKDLEGRYLLFNEAASRFVGRPIAEVIGKDDTALFDLEGAKQVMANDRAVRESGQTQVDEEQLTAAGVTRTFLATKAPYRGAQGAIIGTIGISHDITERKRLELELREREAMLARAQRVGRMGTWVLDLRNGRLTWSEETCELFGISPGEFAGTFEHFYSFILPEDRANINAEHRLVAPTRPTVEAEYRIRRPDDEVRWMHERGNVEFDADGNQIRRLGIVVDITERKKIEEQILRSQRMESIGTLAGGIAHDLNNVLGPILMALDLLAIKFPDADSAGLLDILRTSAQQGVDMVRQVLSFARGVEGRRMELQVAHLVRDIEKIANDTFLKHIQIRTNLPHDLWTVTGDPTQLHQVLLNLCVNARDAMPNGGTLTFSAENLQLDAQYAGLNPDAKPGSYVVLQTEDNGTGMPPGIVEKIFDPFFTTKEIGKGTGLGLSTTLAIVKSHGGFIRVYSELGKGTVFKIYLPAQTEASARAVAESAPEMPRGNGELILVVDDEVSVRLITQQTLEAFGYRVVLAADGAEAVAFYVTCGAEISVVLMDMMMPVMDGPVTIQVLRRINPNVRIIAASGLSANSGVSSAPSLGIKHLLAKPFTADTLLNVLKEILSST